MTGGRFVAEVFVDGVPVTAFSEVWCHYQDDPYPGGHRYVVRLRGPGARRELGDLMLGPRQSSRSTTERVFWRIESLLRKTQPLERSRGRFQHVLNTIDALDAHDDEVVIQGICSPFIERSAPPR